MADLSSGAIGHDSVGAPGESMKGVTGREPVYAMDYSGSEIKDGLFNLPVDSEHKAKKMKIYSFAAPHMRAFHLAWTSFFISFCSGFAAPPLMSIIRENLNLTKPQVGNSGIAAVVGAIFSRVIMGMVCDVVGPRYGAAFLMLGTVPCVAGMVAVNDYSSFLIVRFCIGFVLATFVSCQYWMSSMFNSKIVGVANGLGAGWGNMGGGGIQIIMPSVYDFIAYHLGVPHFTAWRIAFLIPATLQILSAVSVLLLGQDCPDGQYLDMAKKGERKIDNPLKNVFIAVSNYRTWILVLSYGYSFGVELTTDNIVSQYFYDQFDLNITTAGYVAASFGLMNCFTRPLGGVLSDFFARRWGMRGRLWGLWLFQSMNGLLCILLSRMNSLNGAVIVLLLFSFFCQAAAGFTFGVVPFVSRRCLGLVSGMVGAGGNTGSAITQELFFTSNTMSTQIGLLYQGYMILGCTAPIWLIYFPQWGGMVFPASSTATEETYYELEYNEEEKSQGRHASSMRFAENSRSERGVRGAEEFDAKVPA